MQGNVNPSEMIRPPSSLSGFPSRLLGSVLLLSGLSGTQFLLRAQTVVDYDQVRNFKLPEYDEETGDLKSILYGQEAKVYRKDGLADMKEMKIEVYRNNVAETTVTSPACKYQMQKGIATSEDPILIERSDLTVSGIGYTWKRNEQRFEIKNKARVVLKNAKIDLFTTPEKKPDAKPVAP